MGAGDEGSREGSRDGSWAWTQPQNHDRMIAFQAMAPDPAAEGSVEIAYFGASAFRITSPAGLTVMIDPWRNHPAGGAPWFRRAFPLVEVDVGVSTHAHFDHDALHRLSAGTLLDRPVGRFALADVAVTGIADKHVSDTRHSAQDWAALARERGVRTTPPGNCRSFDNCLVLVETGSLRILHWGDNRPDPPEAVWAMLGAVDVALLPVDGSRHVLSDAQADRIAARLGAPVVVPCHYLVEGLTDPASTLLPPDAWLDARPGARRLDGPTLRLTPAAVAAMRGSVLCFGNHVAFAPGDP